MRQYQVLNSAMPVVFDGRVAPCFMLTLRNSVTNARVRWMTPGQVYTFIIYQDQFGHHRLLWPAECHNAGPVNTNPLSVTVQTFVGTENGELTANLAGTWTERAV